MASCTLVGAWCSTNHSAKWEAPNETSWKSNFNDYSTRLWTQELFRLNLIILIYGGKPSWHEFSSIKNDFLPNHLWNPIFYPIHPGAPLVFVESVRRLRKKEILISTPKEYFSRVSDFENWKIGNFDRYSSDQLLSQRSYRSDLSIPQGPSVSHHRAGFVSITQVNIRLYEHGEDAYISSFLAHYKSAFWIKTLHQILKLTKWTQIFNFQSRSLRKLSKNKSFEFYMI